MTNSNDLRFMRMAFLLGQRGLGQVWPNPAVGCVIVKNNQLIGRGWTAAGGRPHAEVVALGQAGPASQGATAYVTLEPCAHTGQTPPCAQALIDAQVARVVVACPDPDPRVSGAGVAMLRAAGISVTTDICRTTAERDHIGFLRRVTGGLPFVTLKLATTLDGRIATRTGESQWITGPDARRAVHALRACHDAVMVGAGTVRADDPQLTVRGMGERRQPVRVIVSKALSLPPDAGLFSTIEQAPVWLCHGPNAQTSSFTEKGIVSLPCKIADGQIDLSSVMSTLSTRGITRVFCEGGGAIAASLLQSRLVDRLELFQAGKVVGGDGLPSIGHMNVAALSQAAKFTRVAQRQVGPDVWTSWDAQT